VVSGTINERLRRAICAEVSARRDSRSHFIISGDLRYPSAGRAAPPASSKLPV
jgi:hypothetical protein